MRGLLQTPKRRLILSSLLGAFCLLVASSLLSGCGPKKPKAALQPAPPSPVEELESKVMELEIRQQQLKQRRAELEGEFSGLKQQQESLLEVRDDVLEAQRQAAERAAAMKEVEAEALAPKKPPEKAAPPPKAAVAPEAGGAGKMPYVVHTSSYRNAEFAFREAKRLAGKGYKAYTSEADLGDKGKWNRVLIGRFASADEARSSAESIKGKEKLSYAAPMLLPYSVALEAYPSADEAKEAKTGLEAKGLHPYIVRENSSGGDKVYRLLLGAYTKKSEAEASAKKASAAGAKTAVIKP